MQRPGQWLCEVISSGKPVGMDQEADLKKSKGDWRSGREFLDELEKILRGEWTWMLFFLY